MTARRRPEPSSRANQVGARLDADGPSADSSVELLAESLPASDAVAPGSAAPLVHESESYVRAVAEAMALLADEGFTAPFDVGEDDVVHCLSCRSKLCSGDVNWMRHIEVLTAAGDPGVVCGVRCPICGARGAATATVEQWSRRRHPTARTFPR